MLGHGQHLAVPDGIAEGAIGRGWDRGPDGLDFAGAARDAHEAIGNHAVLNGAVASVVDGVIDNNFGGEDAILRDAEVAHAGTDDPLVGRGDGPDVASGGAEAAH